MRINKKISYGIYLLCFCVALYALIDANLVRSQKQEKKPLPPCGEFVYVKLGQSHLKLPSDQRIFIKNNNESRRSNCWRYNASSDNPKEASHISFFTKIDIEGYEPMAFDLDIYHTEDLDMWYERTTNDLSKQGKSVDNLPLTSTDFYTYNKIFFKRLSNREHDFMRLLSCIDENKALTCAASFKWKSDVKVNVSATDLFQFDTKRKRTASLDVWLKIHEAIVKQLQAFEYTPSLVEEGEIP